MQHSTNTVEFSCACGKEFRARVEQGGKSYVCPTCGVRVRVPKVAIAQNSEPPPPPVTHPMVGHATRALARLRSLRAPATFGQMLAYLLGSWGVLSIFALVLSLFSIYAKLAAIVLFVLATGAAGEQIWRLLRARQRVLRDKDVPLLWGFVRLIAWDPVEGILILQNKNVGFSDDNLQDGRGGVRFLYPVLGEELALRVPLEVQTLRFADENVLTREYLRVTIRGTMKWRIVDVKKFGPSGITVGRFSAFLAPS